MRLLPHADMKQVGYRIRISLGGKKKRKRERKRERKKNQHHSSQSPISIVSVNLIDVSVFQCTSLKKKCMY